MEQIIEDLNNLLEPKGIKIYEKCKTCGGEKYYLFSTVIDQLANHWDSFSEDEKEEVARTMMKTNKNYLGDIKWVLYQYICDMNEQEIFIKCGNYAFEKIKNIIKDCEDIDKSSSGGYINGEYVRIYRVCEINKKQVIISKIKCNYYSTIYPEDIVLYFA